MPSWIYLVFYLYLHICSARRLSMILNGEKVSELQLSDKDTFRLVAERLVTKDSLIMGENGDYQKNLDGANYNSMVLYNRAGRQIWEKVEPSAPPRNNAKERVNSKEKDVGEDIVVMDYAAPHRKPPIHNRGT